MKCKRIFKWLLQYALYIYMHACVLSHFSHVPVFATLWTVAHQAPLSMRSSNQEYWSGLPCPPPGNLPDTRIKPMPPSAPALQVDSIPLRHQRSPHMYIHVCIYYLNIYICIPTCVCEYVYLGHYDHNTAFSFHLLYCLIFYFPYWLIHQLINSSFILQVLPLIIYDLYQCHQNWFILSSMNSENFITSSCNWFDNLTWTGMIMPILPDRFWDPWKLWVL